MSDRIAVMSDGWVEQIGTPDGDLPPPGHAASSPASSARRTCCPAPVERSRRRGRRRARRRARGAVHRSATTCPDATGERP